MRGPCACLQHGALTRADCQQFHKSRKVQHLSRVSDIHAPRLTCHYRRYVSIETRKFCQQKQDDGGGGERTFRLLFPGREGFWPPMNSVRQVNTVVKCEDDGDLSEPAGKSAATSPIQANIRNCSEGVHKLSSSPLTLFCSQKYSSAEKILQAVSCNRKPCHFLQKTDNLCKLVKKGWMFFLP